MSNETVEKRREKILEKLNNNNKVYVKSMAEEFDVATETIRRDLDYLDKHKKLSKIFGGAVKIKTNRLELIHSERELVHQEGKQKIAATAADLIEDNDTIALQGGSTIEQLVPYLLGKRNLTVVTNSLPITYALLNKKEAGSFDGRIVMLGGETSYSSMSTNGFFAEDMLAKINFNKAFFSCAGFTPTSISTYLYEHIALSKLLIEKSALNILLADASKININHLYEFASLDEIDIVVCDAPMPVKWQKETNLSRLQWLTAENRPE